MVIQNIVGNLTKKRRKLLQNAFRMATLYQFHNDTNDNQYMHMKTTGTRMNTK